MHMLRTATLMLAATLSAFALAGCAATMHTTENGTYVYDQPWLESIEEATLDATWQATQDAMADLEFSIDSRAKDSLQAKLVAEQADDTDVRVDLARVDDDSTRVGVKVGTFGDRGTSELCIEKISARIKDPMSESERSGEK
jgi:hypothetical protein